MRNRIHRKADFPEANFKRVNFHYTLLYIKTVPPKYTRITTYWRIANQKDKDLDPLAVSRMAITE